MRSSMLDWRGMFLIAAALGSPAIGAVAPGSIASAHYAAPVERHGHFALGRPHEYARVVASTDDGRRFSLDLPENEVFEDLEPRRVQLGAGEAPLLLAIVSQRERGARLVLIGLGATGLAIVAQSAAIGTPKRWLNPVAAVDLDGDGRAEIAAVITPHLAGPLKVYRRQGATLVEVAALAGFSNHVFGSPELALSAAMLIDGKSRLLVPDARREQLRIIAFDQGRLVEVGRCALDTPIVGAVRQVSAREITVGLEGGRASMAPGQCSR